MQPVNLRFINVSFSYSVSSEFILSSLTLHFAEGWTGIVGPNGSGIITPVTGGIAVSCKTYTALYCSQETEYPPENSEDFISGTDNRSGKIKSLLEINNDWPARWDTLSHGERKRFQTGLSLWTEPDILALDEPTNHLDISSKKLITKALKTYSGTGILISHDRELLDTLCSSCLFVSPGKAILRPGGISAGLEQERFEKKSKEKAYQDISLSCRKLKQSAGLLKQKENSRKNSLSKKNIAIHDHDSKSKIDLARLTGKDKSGARKIRILEKRLSEHKRNAEINYFKKRPVDGFTYKGEKLRRDSIITIKKSRIPLGPGRYLEIPDITLLPSDKIGITGDNGTGKSTLLKYIYSMISLPDEKLVFIPQETVTYEWPEIGKNIRNLSKSDLGELLSVIYRLGSEPERVLGTPSPSPGEMRKIMLGLGLLKVPSLIMMDEPSNHMDLPSLQCLEDALAGFEGALIIISHDRTLIKKVTNREWFLERDNENSKLLISH